MVMGVRSVDLSAKDIALALVKEIGAEGANYQALEFQGPSVAQLTLEDRLVVSNLGVEMDAKAAIWTADGCDVRVFATLYDQHRKYSSIS